MVVGYVPGYRDAANDHAAHAASTCCREFGLLYHICDVGPLTLALMILNR
jgi:hypothetical protein